MELWCELAAELPGRPAASIKQHWKRIAAESVHREESAAITGELPAQHLTCNDGHVSKSAYADTEGDDGDEEGGEDDDGNEV